MLFKSVNTVTSDPAGYLDGLLSQVAGNQNLIYVGAVCACVNLPLLFVFLAHRPFRLRFQLLITLACADFINCLSIMAKGLERSDLFIDVIATGLMPIKTPFDCVGELWLMLREVGGLWAPMIQIIMGTERILAVFKPAWFNRTYTTRTTASVIISIFFVIISISTAILIAWTRKNLKVIGIIVNCLLIAKDFGNEGCSLRLIDLAQVPYYCGRKAAFTASYGTYVYVVNVFGYAIGFLLNLISYCKVRTFMNRTEKNKNLDRIRYYLVISAMSTVLVSIPNFINLASVLFQRIGDQIGNAANWATAINSGMNFFVYLALNEEFRNRRG